MAKFYGMIGFASQEETRPGVWIDNIIERGYSGDLIRNTRNLQNSQEVNDDISLSNQISILSDPYANENFFAMRYVTFMGSKWKITSVEVQYPRLILSIGGIWNGEPH